MSASGGLKEFQTTPAFIQLRAVLAEGLLDGLQSREDFGIGHSESLEIDKGARRLPRLTDETVSEMNRAQWAPVRTP